MAEIKYGALILFWVCGWHLAGLMEYAPYTSLWYLPGGLSMAAFIVLGSRAIAPILIASILVNRDVFALLEGQVDTAAITVGLLFGLVHTCAYAIGGAFARVSFSRLGSGEFPRRLIIMLVAFALGSFLAALGGMSTLLFTSSTVMVTAIEGLLAWWLGDMIGCLVISPLAIALFSRFWPQYNPPFQAFSRIDHQERSHLLRFVAKVWLVVGFAAAVMLLNWLSTSANVAYFMFFVGIPLTWVIYTEHPLRGALALLVLSLIMVAGIQLLELHNEAVIYQFALCLTAINCYLAMAVPRLMQQNQLLSEVTMTDTLTGISSQAYFVNVVSTLQQQQPNNQHSLLILSIDNIATINATYGRALGDHVLIAIANALRQSIAKGTVLARADNEAFLIFLTNTDKTQAKAKIPWFKRCLPEISHDGFVVPLRSSFSVHTVDSQQSISQLLVTASPTSKSHGTH